MEPFISESRAYFSPDLGCGRWRKRNKYCGSWVDCKIFLIFIYIVGVSNQTTNLSVCLWVSNKVRNHLIVPDKFWQARVLHILDCKLLITSSIMFLHLHKGRSVLLIPYLTDFYLNRSQSICLKLISILYLGSNIKFRGEAGRTRTLASDI